VTVGLLADRFDEPYQQAILRTIEGAAQQRGANLLAFAGGIPGSTLRGSDRRTLMFELVGPRTVDGVILLAGTMVNQLGLDGLGRMLGRIRGLPLCTIGVEVPDVPSIVVDNDGGIKQAMHHLVSHHGARRFGFLGGPVRNKEAEERHAAFMAELERAGLPLDPAFVQHGDFLRSSGERAVDDWLARPDSALPDAIVCANDEMALGVLTRLVKAGVRVPEDVRVVGFDGVEVARLSNPPLSTVRQPLDDLAMMAVRTVMDQIAGRKVAPVQTLQTHLVIRESCGCVLQLTSTGQSQVVDQGAPSQRGQQEDFATAFQRFRQPLLAELARVARGEFSAFAGWDAELFDGFARQVSLHDSSFTQALSQLVGRIRGKGNDVACLQDVLTGFRRFALPCGGNDHQLCMHIENVLQEARTIVAHATERAHGERCVELERFAVTASDVGTQLMRTFDRGELARAVCKELPRLGIDAFFLCCYEARGEHPAGALPAKARLIAAFDAERAIRVDAPRAEAFDTAQLLPEGLLPRGGAPALTRQMSVLPLFLKGEDLGYCLVQARGSRSTVLEALRDQLSTALYGAKLAERAGSA
jgi:DNA-binding LacI/PurR family transcriptional regulator